MSLNDKIKMREKVLKKNGTMDFRINGKKTFGFTELNDKFIDRWLFALLQILHVTGTV